MGIDTIMETNKYRWYSPGFPRYNEAQASVIPFCDQDINLVVCFPTASGKTVVAEAAMSYHIQNGGKVTYLAPFRALCEEKLAKWRDNFFLSKGGVSISVGDHQMTDDRVKNDSLSIMTFESFETKTYLESWRGWVSELALVVIDEAHLISDPQRGAVIETSLMRLTQENKTARIIMLSATLGTRSDIAKWIKRLNNKQTKLFRSDWRPNDIEYDEIVCDGFGKTIDAIVETCRGARNTIVFVHSKIVGKDLSNKMRKEGIRIAFHNASLNAKKREEIERAFSSGKIDVLISTSTLGAGVNLDGR